LRGLLPHLGALARATLRLWTLHGAEWQLVAGPDAPAPRAPRGAQGDAASFIAIPGAIGLYLEVTSPEPGRPNPAPQILAILGEAWAEAMDAAAAREELAARTEELGIVYALGEQLGHAQEVEEVAARVLREMARVTGARRAGLRLYDESRRALRLMAVVGDDDTTIPPEVPVDAPDEVVVARAFRSGEVETGVQPEWVGGEVIAVPITYSTNGQTGRVVGTIALAERHGGGAFTREETRLLGAVARQIGAALENARLAAAERAQQRTARELELAHDLQLRLMPTPDVLRGDAEVAVHSAAAESLGGDFYTFARLGRGRIGVMVGDVASHGFSAALIAAQVMAAAGIHANANVTPDDTLDLLRSSLKAELESTEMYLSIFYGVFDPNAGRITYSNAGHPYAFRVPRFGPVERLATTAPPLGLAQGGSFGRVVLPWTFAQDLLVLCTDGLTDAAAADGSRYGAVRLMQALATHRTLPPGQLLRAVLDDVQRFGASPDDDCTLLVLRA
jgi:sigma-B regulation protein RsbU (phosphoserine phosphatase)